MSSGSARGRRLLRWKTPDLHLATRCRHLPLATDPFPGAGPRPATLRVNTRDAKSGLHPPCTHAQFCCSFVQTPFLVLASWIAAIYLTVYLSWGFIWWLVVK